MPADSIFVVAAVIAMFVVFAVALIWADFQSRPRQLVRKQNAKRRAF
jgi:uncharacterized membrane protein